MNKNIFIIFFGLYIIFSLTFLAFAEGSKITVDLKTINPEIAKQILQEVNNNKSIDIVSNPDSLKKYTEKE